MYICILFYVMINFNMLLQTILDNYLKRGIVHINITLRRVRITIVAVQEQKYYIFRVCVCSINYPACHDKWAPVITAWGVLRLKMEERSPVWSAMEYIEKSSREQPTRVVLQLGGWWRC